MTQSSRRPPLSIRSHLLGIVLFGAVLPLALIGLWLTQSAVRSGRDLLEEQLRASLGGVQQFVSTKWETRRGDLLFLAGNEVGQQMLARGHIIPADSEYLARAAASVSSAIPRFAYRDRNARVLYTAEPRTASTGGAVQQRRVMHVSYPITRADTLLGSLEAQLYLESVLPSDSARLLLPGSRLAVRDYRRNEFLLPLSDSIGFPQQSALQIAGSTWLARIAQLEDPPLAVAVASPLEPYVRPFERDGAAGLGALIAVALVAVMLTTLLTARLSRSIGGLVESAGAVASGDLSRRAAVYGPRELQHLAGSFNAMTESLRRMVADLSARNALAAVGEFAAALSHEVRNALTSVQIDLERVDERSEDAKNRALLGRTLAHVRRLDAAVTGSLRIARSGSVEQTDVQLGELLQETIRIAEPSFSASGTTITASGLTTGPVVKGDAPALQQLFLNLLLNAQQAMRPTGEATVSIRNENGYVVVSVTDNGSGMTSEQLGRAFDPYFTTRPKGTGLGLPIARQIAVAHAGELHIQSTPEAGTTVEVRLRLS